MTFTKFDIDINLNFFIFFILFTTNLITSSIIIYFYQDINIVYYIVLNFLPSILADFVYLLSTTVCTLDETVYIYSSIGSFLSLNYYLLVYNISLSVLFQSYLLAWLEFSRFILKLFMLEHYDFKLNKN